MPNFSTAIDCMKHMLEYETFISLVSVTLHKEFFIQVHTLRCRYSLPDGVIGIFQGHNPSGCSMALGLTKSLTEMSTRCISWG